MSPEKLSDVIEEVVITTKEDPELVKDLLTFYWKTIKKTLTQLKYPYINVEGIGMFKIRKEKLKMEIERVRRIVTHTRPDTYYVMTVLKQRQDNLILMENMLEMVTEIEDRLYIKKQMIDEKEAKKNMEEQETDN